MPTAFRVRVNWNAETHPGFTFTDPKPVVMQYRNGFQPDAPLTRKEEIRTFFMERMSRKNNLYFFPQFVCICGRVYMREADTSRTVTVSYIDITDDAQTGDVAEGFAQYMRDLKECERALRSARLKK